MKYKNNKYSFDKQEDDIDKKWYELFSKYNNTGAPIDLPNDEFLVFQNLCKSCFDTEYFSQLKQNPNDEKWLQTALHKGTFQDRSNSGALLIQSNPIANLAALETLIVETKLSNQKNNVVVKVLMDLFTNFLLPPDRKLISLTNRGTDYKNLKDNQDLSKKEKDQIYAYWQYENDLKEHYFGYLQNIQILLQSAQEKTKTKVIMACSKLLSYSPEKEQMLLPMIINKLGDPSAIVSNKAYYCIYEIVVQHSNMCGVIVNETEKLLFRNNITEKAQTITLGFLAKISSLCAPDVCVKLITICFSIFKSNVEKGEVNNKMMHSILICLRHVIQEGLKEGTVVPDQTIDIMFRLVHFTDIATSIQALCLLFQIVSVNLNTAERFYTALYKKLYCPDLLNLGHYSRTLFFFVIHKAIYVDIDIARAQAFIKRLLELCLIFPVDKTCATLLIVDKLLSTRPELNVNDVEQKQDEITAEIKEKLISKFDEESDDEEIYRDADKEEFNSVDKNIETEKKATSSWVHVRKFKDKEVKENKPEKIYSTHRDVTKYNSNARNPCQAGASHSLKAELILLKNHYHPTIQIFASNIIERKKIKYIGDPLIDFSFTRFLDRFSFRNPKKTTDIKEKTFIQKQHANTKEYKPFGSRNLPVQSLTENCTEEDRYLFQYAEQMRLKKESQTKDSNSRFDVDDNEFDEYLDTLGGKDFPEENDIINEFSGLPKDIDKEDGDDEDDEWSDEKDSDVDENAFGSDGSISLDGDDADDDDASVISFSDDEVVKDNKEINNIENEHNSENENNRKRKKPNLSKPESKSEKITTKMFNKKLKESDNLSSLFVAADDLADMLEETGKNKKHGTRDDIFNKDKSSDKQMKWEDSNRNNFKNKKHSFKSNTGKSSFHGKRNRK